MKTRILILFIALTMLFSLTALAAGYEYNIVTADSFLTARSGDDLSAISEKLDIPVSELNTYFSKNGLLYLAVSEDNKTQIKLSAFTDNFSSAVDDISYLTDDQLKEFINYVSNDEENSCEIVTNGDRKFIKIKDTLQDSGGIYTATQYVTICDSRTFYLFCYNEGENTSDEVLNIFKSFSVNAKSIEPEKEPTDILIIIGIVFFSVLAVVMIIGIFKVLFKSKSVKDVEDIKNGS